MYIYSKIRLYRHPRRSKNMSIHPIVVTYDEGVANFKLRHLIEYVLVLSNIKYMLSLISIISLIVYIKLILLMRTTSIT